MRFTVSYLSRSCMPRKFTRFTGFTSFTWQKAPIGGKPLYSALQIQIHFITSFSEPFMLNGHFSSSLVYSYLTCEWRKIHFWGQKNLPALLNLLRRSHSSNQSTFSQKISGGKCDNWNCSLTIFLEREKRLLL